MNTKRRYLRYTAVYSLVFLVLMAGMLLPMIIGKRTLIWNDDAKSQYYLQLDYMGRLLREFFSRLFSGRFSLRMYDFTIGMGDDINTLVRFHPLDFLSIFVSGPYMKHLYGFLVLLRIYLGGLAFSAYCFYWKKNEQAVLIGSMVYISCGYVLKLVTYHPTFGAAIIMLPLIFISAEEVMRGGRKLLFSFFIFLSFTSNYYFTYMASIAAVIYVLLRFADVINWTEKRPGQRVKDFFRMFFTFVFYYLLGTGMAALTLLPIIARLVSSPRLSGGTQMRSLWLYPVYRYGAWALAMISPYMDIGNVTKLNFAAIAAPALALLLFAPRGKHRTLRIAAVLEIVLLLLPLFGYIMSGFSNVNNRWTYIIAFTVSLVCVVMAEEFPVHGRRGEVILLVLAAVLAAGTAVGTVFARRYPQMASYPLYIWIGTGQAVLFIVLILFMKRRGISAKTRMLVLTAATACSCILNGFITYDSHFGNTAGEFVRSKNMPAYFDRLPQNLLGSIEDDLAFYRSDTDLNSAGSQNASLYHEYQGIAVYNSVLNAEMVGYMLEQENPGQNGSIRLENLDGRTVTENLANVKYILTRRRRPGSIPAGFEPDEELSGKYYTVYKNSSPLAFGYTYDTLIGSEAYQALPALEKQQVMLEAAVVDEEASEVLQEQGDFSIAEGCGDEIITVKAKLPAFEKRRRIEKTAGGYLVKRRNARIRIKYERRAGYECYLRLVGLGYSGPGMVSNHAQVIVKTKSGTRKAFTVRGEDEAYYLPRSSYSICLGASLQDEADKLTIRFKKSGTFFLESAELVYVPVSKTAERIAARNKNALQNVAQSVNCISGTVSLDRDQFMVFSIPFSKGWSVYVDGDRGELFKANTAYMGVFLPQGDHEIVLKYVSPGFRTAVPVFLISWLLFAILGVLGSVKRKKLPGGDVKAG